MLKFQIESVLTPYKRNLKNYAHQRNCNKLIKVTQIRPLTLIKKADSSHDMGSTKGISLLHIFNFNYSHYLSNKRFGKLLLHFIKF